MLCGKAELLEQVDGRAGVAEHVVDADARDRRRALLGKHRRNGFAESADDVVLFNRDDAPGLLRGIEDDFLVERLDRVDVDDLCADALGLERLAAFTASATISRWRRS